MIKLKIFVLVVYICDIFACTTNYCKICPEHTLCIYEVSGPSPQCLGYDTNALLTENDIDAILDKINERRNFIANGRSRYLPAAADMKTIVWSQELATFAQRWVDQCDQSIKPDRNDKCRDLDHSEVGQSIATILGSSSRYEKLSVRNFVEIWFMESMDYTGSVTFYNESTDHKTNYFTQLIWADTDKVGCGKASFFLHENKSIKSYPISHRTDAKTIKNFCAIPRKLTLNLSSNNGSRFMIKNAKPIIVHRLVCNFAPKGNVHQKPVYTIGYAATQCDNGMERDKKYSGLCGHRLKPKGTISTSTNPPSTSLLRILNLFNNDSARKDIDPIYNDLRQIRKDLNGISGYQNLKQAEVNNSYDAIKRSNFFKHENNWNKPQPNNSTFIYGDYFQKRDKGHSRVYHSHDHRNEFHYLHPETTNLNARKYDYALTTALDKYKELVNRKHYVNQQCTRKSEKKVTSLEPTECVPCKNILNKCTRGSTNKCRQNNDCLMISHKFEEQDSQTTLMPSYQKFCACNSLSTTYQSHRSRCAHNANCECVNANCPTEPYPYMLRTLRDIPDDKLERDHNQRDLQYYDILSYIGQPSTSRSILKDSHRTRSFLPNNNPWLLINKSQKSLDRRKQLKRNSDSQRKRREAEEEENFKPFWQMDEHVNGNQPQLKSIRYTTLSNKKSLQNKRTRKQPKSTMKTESITLTYKGRSNNGKRITEKYLSFDELMHLRKLNIEDSGGRRIFDEKQILRESDTSSPSANEMTTTIESPSTKDTPEYSFNTPYMRIKHCTRKLTCTWTAASLTDSAGSIIPGGGNAVGGSRTPPGYVEGCTRTSTCTRDYMNRNKMATLPLETTSPEPEPGDDEDYCERRSLNRRSNNNFNQINSNKTLNENLSSEHNKFLLNESFNSCICYDKNVRTKRQHYNRNVSILRHKNLKRETENLITYESNLLSYADLFYYVVRKIIEMWKTARSSYSHDKCFCNSVNQITCPNLILFYTIVFKYFKTFLYL